MRPRICQAGQPVVRGARCAFLATHKVDQQLEAPFRKHRWIQLHLQKSKITLNRRDVGYPLKAHIQLAWIHHQCIRPSSSCPQLCHASIAITRRSALRGYPTSPMADVWQVVILFKTGLMFQKLDCCRLYLYAFRALYSLMVITASETRYLCQ